MQTLQSHFVLGSSSVVGSLSTTAPRRVGQRAGGTWMSNCLQAVPGQIPHWQCWHLAAQCAHASSCRHFHCLVSQKACQTRCCVDEVTSKICGAPLARYCAPLCVAALECSSAEGELLEQVNQRVWVRHSLRHTIISNIEQQMI